MKPHHHLFLILFILSFQVSGQNISTDSIRWNSSSWFDGTAGTSFEAQTTVTTSPGRILWKFSADSTLHDMTIRKSTGSWTNVAQNGSIVFEGDSGNDSAIVEFKKTGQTRFIRMVIARPEETLIYELQVTTVTGL